MANERVNKVVLGNEVLVDLTEDTVNENNLLAGETAHDASGRQIQGAVVVPEELNDLDDVDINSPKDGQGMRYNGSEWANAEVLHKTAAQSCVIGDTTVTFTDANILTTSEIWPHADTASGKPMPFTSCVVSVDGTAVLTFPALTEAASIYLKITNY